MNIRKFFDLRSKKDKISEYKNLLKKSLKISKEVDELANEFAEQNSILKSISALDKQEKQDATERYDSFLKEHVKKVSKLQKEKARIEKSMISLKEDESITEALEDVKTLFEAKQMQKNHIISKAVYNDIIKAKIGKVKYADVLLFRGDKLLILERTGNEGQNSSKWCIPGGHVEVDEEWREAACRELFEETGFEVPEDILIPVGIATGKDFEIHYFMGHIDDEAPASVLLDSEEEIGSEWIDPSTELDKYDFIFDLKDNIKKILGLEVCEDCVVKIAKAYMSGELSEKIFKAFCEEHKQEIEKANNKTYFSHEERKDLAKKGEAMPDGKFPIRNAQDLKDAIRLSGSSDTSKEKVKVWIKKRAKELNLLNELPEDWKEKAMDCKDTQALKKESLDPDIKGPEGDGIQKAIDLEKIDKKKREEWEKENEVNKDTIIRPWNQIQGEFTLSNQEGSKNEEDFFSMLALIKGLLMRGGDVSVEIKTSLSDDTQSYSFSSKEFRIYNIVKREQIEKGFSLNLNFEDLDEADMFKSLVSQLKEEKKIAVDIEEDNLEKSKKEFLKDVFLEFANFFEGAKTKAKNVHWSETDNAKHVYLDDLVKEMSEYEDKIMEAAQSEFGRFEEGSIKGQELSEDDPIELVDRILEEVRNFYSIIEDNEDYVGEKSWTEDFIATLKQTKYRLQLH